MNTLTHPLMFAAIAIDLYVMSPCSFTHSLHIWKPESPRKCLPKHFTSLELNDAFFEYSSMTGGYEKSSWAKSAQHLNRTTATTTPTKRPISMFSAKEITNKFLIERNCDPMEVMMWEKCSNSMEWKSHAKINSEQTPSNSN